MLLSHSVLYWTSTQLHHLITHSWANWIYPSIPVKSLWYPSTKPPPRSVLSHMLPPLSLQQIWNIGIWKIRKSPTDTLHWYVYISLFKQIAICQQPLPDNESLLKHQLSHHINRIYWDIKLILALAFRGLSSWGYNIGMLWSHQGDRFLF